MLSWYSIIGDTLCCQELKSEMKMINVYVDPDCSHQQNTRLLIFPSIL